jgi:hypothetical protein
MDEKLQSYLIDWIEEHADHLDIWIKQEGGIVTGIDLSRNDLEEPQQPPKTPHLADLLTPPSKVPYIAKYALASAANDFNAAASSMKPFTTENEPDPTAVPLPGETWKEAAFRLEREAAQAAADIAKAAEKAADKEREQLEKEMLGEEPGSNE